MIGLILGNRYELIEKIGEGGMSHVYKAKCNKLNRYVAVKILKKEFADNLEVVTKFKREATAIATLSDNNIVNVLDVGTQEDLNYIVMEYVKGKTLKEVITQFGKMSYETCITVGIQVAKALDCAHRNNIIHRDVKPQNILVTEDGSIKVTDFGIAKSVSTATLTNTTTIMGSAHYFSPEQAKGSFIDTRTDIYSLGIVLYEMATAKLPFDGESPVTIALKHIQNPVVPPKQINPKIPESLNTIILKAMEKDANKRYQSAKEIIQDLQKVKDDPDAKIIQPDNKQNIEDHTIIMAPMKPVIDPLKDKGGVKDLEDDYYDDYEEDEDEYIRPQKSKNKDVKAEKKKGPNKTLIGVIIGIVFLLIIGIGTFIAFGGADRSKTEVEIPTLVGLTKEEAKRAIEAQGLVYREDGVEMGQGEEGKVLRVTPKEGTVVKKGSEVKVVLSGGEAKKKMEDLTSRTLEDAIKRLKDNYSIPEENIEIKKKESDDIKENNVISHTPKLGEPVDKDTKVTLVVSSGKIKKLVAIPDLDGLTKAEAEAKLKEKNLKANFIEREVTDQSKVGRVVETLNKGGSVEEGITVTLYIGKQKPEEYIDLSNLDIVGKSYTEAKIALEAKGFKVKALNDKTDGVVESFRPNDRAKKGDTITLVMKSDSVDNKPNE